MVMAAEHHQVVLAGLAAVGPVVDVVSVEEAPALAAREAAAAVRRASTALRTAGGTALVLRPTLSAAPSRSMIGTREESQASRRALSGARAGPSAIRTWPRASWERVEASTWTITW